MSKIQNRSVCTRTGTASRGSELAQQHLSSHCGRRGQKVPGHFCDREAIVDSEKRASHKAALVVPVVVCCQVSKRAVEIDELAAAGKLVVWRGALLPI